MYGASMTHRSCGDSAMCVAGNLKDTGMDAWNSLLDILGNVVKGKFNSFYIN